MAIRAHQGKNSFVARSASTDSKNVPSEVPEMAAEIHAYWFGDGKMNFDLWFGGGPEVDAIVTTRFEALVQSALDGELEEWEATPNGALAKIILLDQFPRNVFRNTPKAFAGDAQAAALSHRLIEKGWIEDFTVFEKQFAVATPLMHSEELEDHEIGQKLTNKWLEEATKAEDSGAINTWETVSTFFGAHTAVIRRFGRYPSRNVALGRANTPEEEKYINEEMNSDWELSQAKIQS